MNNVGIESDALHHLHEHEIPISSTPEILSVVVHVTIT